MIACLHESETDVYVGLSAGYISACLEHILALFTSKYMYVCMYVCMHVRLYVCAYVRMYVCMYVSMYVCMYVCVELLTQLRFEDAIKAKLQTAISLLMH